MAKNRKFIFTDNGEPKEIEAVSFKKAVKSFQSGTKSKKVNVEWTSKRGVVMTSIIDLPMGRKKKLAR
jgi:intracellular sulfur oxidation DsrE/DsrF family protein